MNQPVSINPEGLRNAANQFDAISDTTRQILNTLTGGASAEGEPWGDDKAGKKFSEGSQGYLANRDGTFKSLGQLVDLFGQNRDNLRDSAKTFEQNESQVTNSTPSGSGSVPSSSGSGSSSSSSYSTSASPRLFQSRVGTVAQPTQAASPEQPLQPRLYDAQTPLQPRQYSPEIPATQPRQFEPASQSTPVGQSTPGTPLQPREYSQEIPATQATPEIPATQPRLYEATQATPEVYGQTLQPREYSAEIPATEGERVQATPETYRTLEEQPLQSEQAFPRVQAQPVQNPNQT